MPTPLQKNQIVQLAVASISSDGNGVARHNGQVVFVPGAAVGDVLRAKIVKAAKTHAYARIEQVVTPGPGRRQPDCPIAGTCGGCAFRHLTYEAELAAKQGFVQDALARIGGLAAEVLPILPSPEVDRYRNKAQIPVAMGPAGPLFGFYAARSHRIVPCDDCLLQPALFSRIAAHAVRLLGELGAAPYDETAHTGLVRHIYLRQSHQSGEVMLCLVVTDEHLPGRERFAAEMVQAFPAISTVVLNINPAKTNVICGPRNLPLIGDGTIGDALCGVPVRLSPLSFAQVNTPGAAQLFAVAQEYAAPGPGDTLLDLYCGTGVIGLSMAGGVASLIGVEVVRPAVDAAKASAAAMGLANTRFLCEDTGAAAKRLAAEGKRVDIITVDPPRKGCDTAAIEAMLALGPHRIVMVSCNPATLARDLAALVAGGYRLCKVQPVDMFPRTNHVECVALLEHAAKPPPP